MVDFAWRSDIAFLNSGTQEIQTRELDFFDPENGASSRDQGRSRLGATPLALPFAAVSRPCRVCGNEFVASQDSHINCSAACRQKAHRDRVREAYRLSMGPDAVIIDGRARRNLSCRVCGHGFLGKKGAKVCSRRCSYQLYGRPVYRRECGLCQCEFLSTQTKKKYCSEKCLAAALSQKAKLQHLEGRSARPMRFASASDRWSTYAAARYGVYAAGAVINRAEIFERDGWLCQICGEEIDRDLKWPHKLSATIDHKVPLVRGGRHVHENVQAAHLSCNSRKGANG